MEQNRVEKKKFDWRLFLALVKGTNPPRGIMITALVMSLLTTGVGFAVPLFTKRLVDGFSGQSFTGNQIAILVAAFVLQALASGLSIYLLAKVGHHVVAKLREKLWDKLLRLPVRFHHNNDTGETLSRVTNDTSIVKELITEHLTSFVTGIISIVGSIIILLILDWKMTIVMLLAVPVAIIIIMVLGRQMYRVSKMMQEETAKFTAVLNQVLPEMKLVKASNAEHVEQERGNKGIRTLFTYGLKEAKIQALLSPLMLFIMMLLLVTIIGYGGVRVASGALSAGDMVAFILYLFQIIMPMTQLSMFFTHLQKAMGATERIYDVLGEETEDAEKGKPITHVDGDLHMDEVSFAYQAEQVLHNLSFSAPAGKVTAIAGPSGGGKSTLFGLLERYYEPTSGVIRLGTEPISNFKLQDWRRQIGYVAQETALLSGTIRENICYGLEREIPQEELERVSEMAYAKQFIEELPEGFETKVGERGVKLSGGQRQRIAIARALLRDPQILMLDEATSSLDSSSEIYVQRALQNLMQNRTTFVIAHRLSTIVDADQIVFIERGRITGIGTHGELFERHELYRQFASQQQLLAGKVD
ncbi:ATP-binding cassette, subfamily B, AbcA/BmrA [Terribacillus aidingensis]|uniref:ATP-binding cassette, subfamily B, AbcA/BmrA n=1 Tax=Terribacillus aidingensis TaxID=586416 RepID=A0A285P3M4_9BACI|nr:ABC transporter ATP-binding protein [Terribacillus aidingensis]SNZ16335.1 ATP-binding cassette, subfamily B, AbcA/BmrA [Terribacillus aidingensis]